MRSHEECRKAVCVLCMSKSKVMQNVTECIEKTIKKYFIPTFDRNDSNFPLSVCGACKFAVADTKKQNCVKKNINLFDYTQMKRTRILTVRNPVCCCTICNVAHSKAKNISKSVPSLKNKCGRPRSSLKPKKIKVCSICLNSIQRGHIHDCRKICKINNLKKLAGNATTIEKLASSVIIEKQNENKENVILPRVSGGHSVKLSANSARHNTAQDTGSIISSRILCDLKTNINLSTTKTVKLTSKLRKSLGNNMVDTVVSLKSYIKNHEKRFDEFFTYETVDFKLKNSVVPEILVYCKNLPSFIELIVKTRVYSETATLQLKIGLDSGGDFLKICLNIHDLNHCSAGSVDFKDTGVKKLFILAIASDVEENYSNMLLMLNKLNLTSPDSLHYPVRFSNDLKMNNILVGIMNHSSAHPCCWCDVLKGDLIECGNMRTIRNIQSDYDKWCKSGKNLKMRNCSIIV